MEQHKTKETLFQESLNSPRQSIRELGDIDLVIGIPFYNEKDTINGVLRIVEEGLSALPHLKSLILCVGDPGTGNEVLEAIREADLKFPHLEFLMNPGTNGRGQSIRAIFEISKELEADVVLLEADLQRQEASGFQPEWIKRLAEPVRDEYDFVLASFEKHPCKGLIDSLFMSPLLEVFYNYRIRGALSGIYAVSHDLIEDYCSDFKFWGDIIEAYGVDPWLVTRAIRWNKKICGVELGSRLENISLEKFNYVFKEIAKAMFECIKRDEEWWAQPGVITKAPDIYNAVYPLSPPGPYYPTEDLVLLFKRSFNQYRSLYNGALPSELAAELQDIVSAPSKDFRFSGKTWAQIVYYFLFNYWFTTEMSRDDVLNNLTFAFGGRIAGFVSSIQALQEALETLNIDSGPLAKSRVDSLEEEQRKEFLAFRDTFRQMWEKKALEVKPPLVPAHYLEFVPGIPIVLPKKVVGLDNRVVWTEGLFNQLQQRYQEAFNRFVHTSLQAPRNADSVDIAGRIRDFMGRLEKAVDFLFPGNIYSEEGTVQVVEELFKLLPHPKMFSIKTDVFRETLLKFPPVNVMIPAGCASPGELLERMDPRDAITLANLVETRKYTDRSLLWVLDNLKPGDMEEVDIKPIVLGPKVLDGSVRLGNISDLNKLTTRIVVRPLSKGMGGDYPKLRFCLFIARHIMIAENYSYLWMIYARERKHLGAKIRNSLIGRYETGAFSAHNIFENCHHRALVRNFRALATKLEQMGYPEEAQVISMMVDSYGLSQVLDDGTFIPCSAWSWASYSYKGGKGIPTPLSNHVEEKWFNHDLLEEIYTELGYDPAEIMQRVVQLIGEGRASENLLDVLLGIGPKDVVVVVQDIPSAPAPAKPLSRYPGNPILLPIKEHYWESKYVLNAATFRIKDRVYILYRAFGDDEVSRIGLAITDGYKVIERLPYPVFSPRDSKEKKGCEDPRVVIIGDEIYMLYTSYDGVIAQIAAASIKIEDFLNRRFDRWQRRGLAFEDIWDKDAILFPEKINGRYVIYHRIEPSVWVSYLDKLEFPVPKEKHSIIFGPRSGRMWDSLKIGAGSQPLKTRYGWLLIYHGVDTNRVYRLGVILVDLKNPERLLYRSPNPILSPETEYEIGKKGECWVSNVVFTCGAVPAQDKEVLDAEDEILVYYGAADSSLCVASAKVKDLIPENVRQRICPDKQP